MNVNLGRPVRASAAVVLGMTFLLAAGPAVQGAVVTFDFDSGTPAPAAQSTMTPFANTVDGVTANLSALYDFPLNPGYSLQSNATFAGSIHLNGPWFSGNFLSPGNTQGPLYITFSQPVNNISLSFATADANQNEDGTFLELVAYDGAIGSNPVGSVNGNAHYGSGGAGATYPEGTLTLNSATNFTSVMLHLLPNQPPTSAPPAAAFFVDNVVVNVVPEPVSLAGLAIVSLLMLCGRRR